MVWVIHRVASSDCRQPELFHQTGLPAVPEFALKRRNASPEATRHV